MAAGLKPDEFIGSLKNNVPGIVVCTGEETFFKEEVFSAVKAALRSGSPGLSVTAIDPTSGEKEAELGFRLLKDLFTSSLFSETSLLLVRNGQDVLKSVSKELGECMASGRSFRNRVVFFAKSVDGRTRFGKELVKTGGIVKCRKLYSSPPYWQKGASDESELNLWTVKKAASMGIRFSLQTASFLTTLTGNDLFGIITELEKISLSIPHGEERVSTEDVERSTGMSAVHTPFEIWDKIETGDTAGALETLDAVFCNGMRSASGKLETDAGSIAAILFGIFRERVRLSANVALLVWEKKPDNYISKCLNIGSRFYLGKLKESAARLTAARLKTINTGLLAAERHMKRDGYPGRTVIEQAVVELSRAGK